ncbi:MAG TPA: sugar phosphate isomerase/epimerase [Terriglobales bacterium]|nr:sugar phosphate isomerase/epimerase [Terriglobales bacterium]
MDRHPSLLQNSRRNFLVTSGTVLAAAAVNPSLASANPASPASPAPQETAGPVPGALPKEISRKVPIGVFDPAFPEWTLDQMLEKFSAWGVEAVEIGTGGYPGSHHCPVQELLDDPAKLRAWKKKFDDRNIQVATLSCHGNPLHPDSQIAARDAETFRKTVQLAEKLDVKVIVGFSGCPGGSPTDTQPNWVTYRWPPEYAQMQDWQWKEKVVPYWKGAAKYAREHGVHRLAFEMHPNFVVYNPRTLLKLRDAVGEEIGANCDLSHLFWQACDAVTVIHLLGKHGALFHAHMKDTCFYKNNVDKYGMLNFAFETKDLPEASETFRSVGYGHGANTWKEILRAYMEVGYDGIFSIENEDPILPGEVGVQRALYVLKNVRAELLGVSA